jgi:hypothetical protein
VDFNVIIAFLTFCSLAFNHLPLDSCKQNNITTQKVTIWVGWMVKNMWISRELILKNSLEWHELSHDKNKKLTNIT